MARKIIRTVYKRRKREGKTNYKKRLATLKSDKARLVVRKTDKNIIAQIVEFSGKGDHVLMTVDTRCLSKYGWELSRKNTSAGYLLGLVVAKNSPKKQVILDIGLRTPTKGGVVFAVLKGAVDGGLEIPHSSDVIPDEGRISGKVLAGYLQKSPESSFQTYRAKNINQETYLKMFEQAKQKILGKNDN